MNNNAYHVIRGLRQKTGVWRSTFTVGEGKRPLHVRENRIFCRIVTLLRETSSWKDFNLNQVDINIYLESPDCKLSFDPGILAEI